MYLHFPVLWDAKNSETSFLNSAYRLGNMLSRLICLLPSSTTPCPHVERMLSAYYDCASIMLHSLYRRFLHILRNVYKRFEVFFALSMHLLRYYRDHSMHVLRTVGVRALSAPQSSVLVLHADIVRDLSGLDLFMRACSVLGTCCPCYCCSVHVRK